MSCLYGELDGAILKCPLTENKYIPAETIRQKIIWSAVENLLPLTVREKSVPLWDNTLKSKIQEARKVIAIFVLIGQSKTVESLLLSDGELKDDDLPLSRNESNLWSRHGKRIVTPFKDWDAGAVSMFLEKQWMALEPPLKFSIDRADDIQLDEHCPLSVAFSCCVEATVTGTSGQVRIYKGALKQEQSSFRSERKPPSTVYVALKIFEQKRTKEYLQEKKVLKNIHSKGVINDHLITHMATCDQFRCIIFPWADGGDLGQFWEREVPREASDFLWSLRQIVGLAQALKDLHGVNCRHGDLKPANILYFTNNGVGILKIADLGVARPHTTSTDLRQGATITSASTRIYEGPETYGSANPRSRRYDCWSMGCIILEFVVWLLYDFTALESFLATRTPPHNCYYLSKHDYNPQDNKSQEKAEVHPMVYVAMDYLRCDPRCKGTALEALVGVVDKGLLKINPSDRLEAADLHQQLQTILKRAENDRLYLVNMVDANPVVPEIFSRPPLHTQPVLDTIVASGYITAGSTTDLSP